MKVGDHVVITKRIGISWLPPMATPGDEGVIHYITSRFVGVYIPHRGYGVDVHEDEFKAVEPYPTVEVRISP